jgi:hypothetical protein
MSLLLDALREIENRRAVAERGPGDAEQRESPRASPRESQRPQVSPAAASKTPVATTPAKSAANLEARRPSAVGAQLSFRRVAPRISPIGVVTVSGSSDGSPPLFVSALPISGVPRHVEPGAAPAPVMTLEAPQPEPRRFREEAREHSPPASTPAVGAPQARDRDSTKPSRDASRSVAPPESVIQLPPVDIDRQPVYARACSRLLASATVAGKRRAQVILVVAPGPSRTQGPRSMADSQQTDATGEAFSLLDLARASVGGRTLIVAADGEIAPPASGHSGPGLVDVWRGERGWSEVIARTSDPAVDLVAWGSGEPLPGERPFPWDEVRADYGLILVASDNHLAGPAALLARTVDEAILVVRLGQTTAREVAAMTGRLERLRARLAGCIIVEPSAAS